MASLGHKIAGGIKTIGSKFLQLGANYIGSKGNVRSALAKTLGQTITGQIPSNTDNVRMITGM